MTVYDACIVLGVWHIAKVRAQIWSISKNASQDSVIDLHNIIKSKFKELSMIHHPDKGGDVDQYINIKQSYEKIKDTSAVDFINALDDNKRANISYFNPGSEECLNCTKWSGICITTECAGLDPIKKSHVSGNHIVTFDQRKENVSNSGFLNRVS